MFKVSRCFRQQSAVRRPVARIFRGGGGGAYLNNPNQIINFEMIRYASSEDTEGRVSNLQSQMGTTFNDRGNVASAEGARL